MSSDEKVGILIQRGVSVPSPGSVYISPEVDIDRIASDGVVLHPGTRISGSSTLVMDGACLGAEAPVTLDDCQVGPGVSLAGGYFSGSVFLENSSVGSCAHVRNGCILEEEASCAHSVGIKQTILMPYVTLGSLINFCDCLMAGGTGKSDHSEVGSSYIHFNFTPNQDKATASIMGDVPRGVMLRERPVFLGGQGGLVGPSRIGFGTVIAAGVVYRGNELRGGRLINSVEKHASDTEFHPGLYFGIRHRVINNLNYIANLVALLGWYENVRRGFMCSGPLGEALFEGACGKIEMCIDERISRLGVLAEKMQDSVLLYTDVMKEDASPELVDQQDEFSRNWPRLRNYLEENRKIQGDSSLMESFLDCLPSGVPYLDAVRSLDAAAASSGTGWLENIVTGIVSNALDRNLPSFMFSA